MDNRKYFRDAARTICALLFSALYIPHLLFLLKKHIRELILSDIKAMDASVSIKFTPCIALLFLLHNNSYFRTLFYHRIGPIGSLLIGWYRPGNRYFTISATTKIAGGVILRHPYSSIINADSIGSNFLIRQCTTIGNDKGKRPIIGNNVQLGAAVNIIGGITIGDNVIIGAGSVVVKSVKNNVVIAGVPAKIIKEISYNNESN